MAIWYCIPPANYLETVKDWPYHMIIAPHLLNNEKYYEFYVTNAHRLHTIIDNGLWEGHVVSNSKLLKLADYCMAEEIIAPDHVSGAITVNRTSSFIDYLKQHGRRQDFKIHGAVHGKKFSEARKCLFGLLDMGVDVISMPKSLGSAWRKCLAEYVFARHNDTPIHYLGYYKEELSLLNLSTPCPSRDVLIRSFDTSVPFKPNYGEKFDLTLPYTLRNRIRISNRVRKWKKRYKK